ncbi:MAG: diguanylate cyclase [Geobacteraceae bacterium]|nr:diguanylate cyclase [Geobacteraceae bacterium]
MRKLGFVTTFMVTALVIVALVLSGTFLWFHLRTEKLSMGLVHQQAQTLFRQIVLTQRWITQHGGVFVQVFPGVDPNPYLTILPGLKVTIKDEDGVRYTLRNPGLATREISQLANESGLFTVRITSLKPVNELKNSPDAFERDALQKLETGIKEVSKVDRTAHGVFYRYVAPLYYETSCNRCHSHQGYNNGDIRGGISISIPMDKLVHEMKLSRLYTLLGFIVVFGTMLLILFIIARRFMREMGAAQEELEKSACTDSLTGLFNRKTAEIRFSEEISRHSRAGEPLSCLMLDVDHFKNVNDNHGHQIGDWALVEVARVISGLSRQSDAVFRYGGEEFLVLLTNTPLQSALIIAERMRKKVEEDTANLSDGALSITISCGAAQYCDNESVENFIGRADAALYRAKATGRNRVCTEIGA